MAAAITVATCCASAVVLSGQVAEAGTAGYGGKIKAGKPVCVEVPGAKKNDWVFTNITMYKGNGVGHVTMYPNGDTKIVPNPAKSAATSSGNWSSRRASPNTTLVQAGDGGIVCATTQGGSVHLIMDALAIAKPDTFKASQRRLLDTRKLKKRVNNSSECFKVPNGANKWVVVNATAIGHGDGWAKITRPGKSNTYSTVNFRAGDIDSNMAIIKVGKDGRLCYQGSGKSDGIVDLIAIAKDGTFIENNDLPKRIKNDRRPSSVQNATTKKVGGAKGGWAFVSAAPIPGKTSGYARFNDCANSPSSGSDVNYADRVDPNVGVVKTASNRGFCLVSKGGRAGWVFDMLAVAKPGKFTTPPTRRFFDSRLAAVIIISCGQTTYTGIKECRYTK